MGDVPGLKSVPRATGHAGVDEPPGRRGRVGHQEPGRRRQQRRDRRASRRRRPGQRLDAGVAGRVRGGRPTAPRARPPAPRRRTAPARRHGAGAPSRSPPRPEDPPALVGREHALLAEHVARRAPGRGPRRPAAAPRSRSGRRPRCRRAAARNSGGTAWAPRYVGTTSIGPSRPSCQATSISRSSVAQVEAVAGLRLDRRDAVARASRRASAGRGARASSASAARVCGDGRQDPAARGEDLEVARAPLAQDQLVLARAREQQVRVGIDQARA